MLFVITLDRGHTPAPPRYRYAHLTIVYINGLAMHIFVDESGGFMQPHKANRVSAIGAVIVPESQHRPLLRAFNRLVAPWRGSTHELKGSQLSEFQVAQVVDLVGHYDAILQVCAIDMGMHDISTIESFRQIQADGIVANITPEYQNWRAWAVDLRRQVLTLSPQLFVQAIVIAQLLGDVLQNGTLYYVCRWPRALERFRWQLDAKDVLVTPFEKLWTELLLPMLQSRSVREPLVRLKDANYEYFERFRMLREHVPSPMRDLMQEAGCNSAVDLRKVYRESFELVPSHMNCGIQVADILVNATTRALNGALSEAGWEHLGTLMVRGVRPGLALVGLDSDATGRVREVVTPYGTVMRKLNEKNRELIPPDHGA